MSSSRSHKRHGAEDRIAGRPARPATPVRVQRGGPQVRGGVPFGWIAVAVLAVAIGSVIWFSSQHTGQQAAGSVSGTAPSVQGSGGFSYTVGSPGPGDAAPDIQLAAIDGSSYDLTAWRGKTVLLFFEEGVACQPCWDQLKDIHSNFSQFQALGVEQIVTITGDDSSILKQKVAIERITTPVLSDPGLRVSQTYHANTFGMMGNGADGHTFIVVGPDGHIEWRADYGGAPKYTMFVPVKDLAAEMRKGMGR